MFIDKEQPHSQGQRWLQLTCLSLEMAVVPQPSNTWLLLDAAHTPHWGSAPCEGLHSAMQTNGKMPSSHPAAPNPRHSPFPGCFLRNLPQHEVFESFRMDGLKHSWLPSRLSGIPAQ